MSDRTCHCAVGAACVSRFKGSSTSAVETPTGADTSGMAPRGASFYVSARTKSTTIFSGSRARGFREKFEIRERGRTSRTALSTRTSSGASLPRDGAADWPARGFQYPPGRTRLWRSAAQPLRGGPCARLIQVGEKSGLTKVMLLMYGLESSNPFEHSNGKEHQWQGRSRGDPGVEAAPPLASGRRGPHPEGLVPRTGTCVSVALGTRPVVAWHLARRIAAPGADLAGGDFAGSPP